MTAQAQLRSDAWVQEGSTPLSPEQFFASRPHFLLEHVRDLSPTCAAFWLLRGSLDRAAGAPVPARELRETLLNRPEKCRILLYPDSTWWKVVRLIEDAPSGRVQLILQRE